MASIIHGTAQTTNWIPTNFAPSVEGFMRSSLEIAGTMYDASAWSTGGGVVKYPLPGALTAQTKTSETLLTEYTGTASAEAVATITLSTQYAVPMLIELIAMEQVTQNVDLMTDLASRGGYAMRKAFETALCLLAQTATTNDVTLSTDNTVTWALLLSGWGKLANQNISPHETTLGMSGPAWAASVADWGTNYTSASQIGGNTNFLSTGRYGQIGQTAVYVTSDWESDGTTGDEAATLWHKHAIGWAIQGGVSVLGPTPHILGAGYTLGLYMTAAGTLAINAFAANFNNP